MSASPARQRSLEAPEEAVQHIQKSSTAQGDTWVCTLFEGLYFNAEASGIML